MGSDWPPSTQIRGFSVIRQMYTLLCVSIHNNQNNVLTSTRNLLTDQTGLSDVAGVSVFLVLHVPHLV